MSVDSDELEATCAGITERLELRFVDAVSPAVVGATVRRCADRFLGAKISTFVPMLVERRSVEALKLVARAAGSGAKSARPFGRADRHKGPSAHA